MSNTLSWRLFSISGIEIVRTTLIMASLFYPLSNLDHCCVAEDRNKIEYLGADSSRMIFVTGIRNPQTETNLLPARVGSTVPKIQ